MAGSRAVQWVLVDHAAKAPVEVGDLVSADAGGMPTYRVMALEAGRAWLSDDRNACLWVRPLDGFQWKLRPRT